MIVPLPCGVLINEIAGKKMRSHLSPFPTRSLNLPETLHLYLPLKKI
ncbi:hypothetical protein [Allocoleopsis franciscana]|nr:hypothetical protein [Allocoleopsis franciscana]